MAYIILFLVLFFFPLTAQASHLSGQKLLEKINSPTTTLDHLEGMEVVASVLFAWEGKSHCKPPLATVGQATAITQKFLNENPSTWHLNGDDITGAALG